MAAISNVGLRNGYLPASVRGTIPGTAREIRVELIPQTAALRAAFQHRFNKPLVITDGYRDYARQVILKQDKGSYAATPGKSNHGWGTAIDFGSRVNIEGSDEYKWMKENAPEYGWLHPKWAEDGNPYNGQQEPWHWEAVYVESFPGSEPPTPSAPAPAPKKKLRSSSNMYWFGRVKGSSPNTVWIGDLVTRRTVNSETEFADIMFRLNQARAKGLPVAETYPSPSAVPLMDRIDWLGDPA